jgi:ribokinase
MGARTILDPAPAQALSAELLRMVDILTPNETEAHALLGGGATGISVNDAPKIARALLATGCGSVVLKLGAKGCFYSDGITDLHAPGFSVKTVDTTAAGDVFNGGLAVSLAEGIPIAEALRFANCAAALSTTKVGAQSSVPMRSDVEAFLKSCAS